MAGEQYVYSEGDAAWFSTFLARVEKQSKGYMGLSLTNFATSTVCAIAAGSVVEIDGAMFHFAAEASVSGAIATGLNYIICSVTGTTAEPYWSQNAASVYDTVKQGFYTAAERYVAGCDSDGALTQYNNKWVQVEGQKEFPRETRYLTPTLTGYNQDGNARLLGTTIQFLSTGDTNTETFSPVNLPDGAIVTELKAWIDSDATITVTAALRRSPLNSNAGATMAVCATSAASITAVTDSTISLATIDNENNSYFIKGNLSGSPAGNLFIHGVRIKYFSTKSLP